MQAAGLETAVNPFGVLFNPVSISSAVERMRSGVPFTAVDVIQRAPLAEGAVDRREGRDSGYVSFHHHGSFSEPSPEAFLARANSSLLDASRLWLESDVVIVTFGTAWVFEYVGAVCPSMRGRVVANCHKHPGTDFRRRLVCEDEIFSLWDPILSAVADKRWIFTISPILHKADGLEGNRLSKQTLCRAVARLVEAHPACSRYFHSYEMMTERLTAPRYWSPDGSHPSPEAVELIWAEFRGFLHQAPAI